jgi:hypothetical protein
MQRGTFPNLMVTPMLHTQEGFDSVVLQGVREEKGMGSFAKDLSPTDSAAIREYLVSRANALKAGAGAGPGAPGAAPPPPPRAAGAHEEG